MASSSRSGPRSAMRDSTRPGFHPYDRNRDQSRSSSSQQSPSGSAPLDHYQSYQAGPIPSQPSYYEPRSQYQQQYYPAQLLPHHSYSQQQPLASISSSPLNALPSSLTAGGGKQQQHPYYPQPSQSGHRATDSAIANSSRSHTIASSKTSHSSVSGTPKPMYSSRATIIIIGMKGAGKTTLGMIANRTLGRHFVDADQYFRNEEKTTLESYVERYGWKAFRQRETSILNDLLRHYPYDAVIACGGGIVESDDACQLLQEARTTFPVIQVLREEDAIYQYAQGQWLRPHGSEGVDAMIKRRAALYRQCCSHTFYNLTCRDEKGYAFGATDVIRVSRTKAGSASPHPLKFKQVGESFMRLLQCILGNTRKNAARLIVQTPDSPATVAPAAMQTQSGASASSLLGRNSISHLLSSHGPGPDSAIERRSSPSARQAQVESPVPIRSSTFTHTVAVLPRRANIMNRNSLLTRRTTAMSLTFPDLTKVDPVIIQQITQGVDALEVRIDMLECMKPASAVARSNHPEREPLIQYEEIARQIETLRRLLPDFPILFTLRSNREGGYFYDDRKLAQREYASLHSQAIYFFLLEMAIGMGVELLDVELGWDPTMTHSLIERRGRTRIVQSYHDLKGDLRWDGKLPQQLYDRSRSFGSGVHVVMMIGTASRASIEQNNYTSAFTAKISSAAAADPMRRLPPLMALNMGLAGRSSRPFNNVLNFVSHPSMPIKAGRGQFSLKEMMETLVRLSIIQPTFFHLYGDVANEADLCKRAIQAAFDEFGLPYTLSDERTWILSEFIAVHQREDVPDRDEESVSQDTVSDGLFMVGQAHRQAELYHVMERKSPHRISMLARVVQSVDILAREDMARTLIGTERGAHAPSSLAEMRGPLVGCHSLPASMYRVLSAHLAPINSPNVNRGALVVVLEDTTKDTDAETETTIAKRSAVYALVKLGFGSIYVVDEAAHHDRSRGSQSRRASMTPAGSRDTSLPPIDHAQQQQELAWSNEVLQLAMLTTDTSSDPTRGGDREGGAIVESELADNIPADVPVFVRPTVKHIGLRSLTHASHHFPHTPSSATDAATDQTKADDRDKMDTDEDPQTAADMEDFARHPTKRPCAVIVVGGTDSQQLNVMRFLWDSEGAQMDGSLDAADVAKDNVTTEQSQQTFVLPRDVWETSFGGTIVRVPSTRTAPMGKQTRERMRGNKDDGRLHDAYPGTTLMRKGWLHVAPWVLDRDRVERTVVEAWTRRSAPHQHLRGVWNEVADLVPE